MKNEYVTLNAKITLTQDEYQILLEVFDRLKTKVKYDIHVDDIIGAYVVTELTKLKVEGGH